MINVLVVDDQKLTHRLIETYLKTEEEIEIVGFANNGEEAIEKVSHLHPDIVLMDVEMPKIDGLSATKIITQKYNTKVLILTVHDNEQHLSSALKNGARGYLLKTITAQELKNAISYAYQGYFQLSIELTEKYLKKIVHSTPQSEEFLELKKKINYLYKSLNKLENRLEQIHEIASVENIERQIESILEKEMSLLADRDSHLQFKVDRINHSQERLQQNFGYIFKILLCFIGINLLAILYVLVSNLG
jgi:DNA-binding NarL/FixJ family response regulator